MGYFLDVRLGLRIDGRGREECIIPVIDDNALGLRLGRTPAHKVLVYELADVSISESLLLE